MRHSVQNLLPQVFANFLRKSGKSLPEACFEKLKKGFGAELFLV